MTFPLATFRTSKWQPIDWAIVAVLLVAGCILFLPALGSPGILSSDGYYSSAAREMLLRHDLITPYLNYKPFYDKPILTYWLILASYKVFGITTFAARLPSSLCAIAAIASLFVLMRQFFNRRAAFIAAAIMGSSPLFAVVGHLALTDMPLTLFTMLASLFFLIVLIRDKRQYLLPAYIAFSLAFLSKGPMAVFVVGSCIVGFLLLTSASAKSFFNRILSLNPLLGVVILLLVDAPWFVTEHVVTNGDFTRHFFIQQNFGRLSGQLQSHVYPFWFYFPYLLGGFFPWSIMIWQSPFILRLRKKRFVKSARTEVLIAAACWLTGTLLLLLTASSKLPTYLLPLAPPIAIIVGAQLERIIRLANQRLIIWTAPLMVLSSLLFVPLVGYFLPHSESLISTVAVVSALLACGFLGYGILLLKSRISKAVCLLLICCAASCAMLVPIGLIEEYKRGPEGLHSLLMTAQKQGNSRIAILPQDVPSTSFYANAPMFELEMVPRDCITFLKTTSGPHYVIVESQFLSVIQRSFGSLSQNIAQKENWNLLFVKDIPPEGLKLEPVHN